MSISGAISNALSGLLANSRRAATVSANISNALTEGYGRRSVTLASQGLGGHGGVRVAGVERHYDAALLADRWLSDAGTGFASTRQAFAAKVEADLGSMQSPSSLAARVAEFEILAAPRYSVQGIGNPVAVSLKDLPLRLKAR